MGAHCLLQACEWKCSLLEEQWGDGTCESAQALKAKVGLNQQPPEVLQSYKICAICLCEFEDGGQCLLLSICVFIPLFDLSAFDSVLLDLFLLSVQMVPRTW